MPGQLLIADLLDVPTGRADALRYQLVIRDLLQYLFCPPLDLPEYELAGNEGRDRRDIIFENRERSGFWPDLRDRYRGEFLVFDAKNTANGPTKSDVLPLAHYLKPYGCGMFGGLVIRGRETGASFFARREQWISMNKMIVVLNDEDLEEMVDRRSQGEDVSYYIAGKIARFRMSL